jgi:hypothetical protein
MTNFIKGQKVKDFYGVISYVIEQRETTVLTTNGIYHITKIF